MFVCLLVYCHSVSTVATFTVYMLSAIIYDVLGLGINWKLYKVRLFRFFLSGFGAYIPLCLLVCSCVFLMRLSTLSKLIGC